MMEVNNNKNYFCQKQKCDQLFNNHSEHPLHKNSLLRIPEELSSYEFKKKLGQGAFGVVFLVYDSSDKQEKVIKLIRIEESLIDGDIDILKRLHHSNIIGYYGSGVIRDECAYVLMELCDDDLDKMIKEKRFATFEDRLKIFKQICKGIQYFHKVKLHLKKRKMHAFKFLLFCIVYLFKLKILFIFCRY